MRRKNARTIKNEYEKSYRQLRLCFGRNRRAFLLWDVSRESRLQP